MISSSCRQNRFGAVVPRSFAALSAARRAILSVGAVLAMLTAPGIASAAGWYTCTIDNAGPGGGVNIYIRLTCDGGLPAQRWFIARQEQEKEILATALTAIALGKSVATYLEGSATYSRILYFYVNK